jgi:hypothetical protein
VLRQAQRRAVVVITAKEILAKQDAALKTRDPSALSAEERIERARKQFAEISIPRKTRKSSETLQRWTDWTEEL